MQTITTIGLDIAKSVFQVHGVDNDGKVVIPAVVSATLRPRADTWCRGSWHSE